MISCALLISRFGPQTPLDALVFPWSISCRGLVCVCVLCFLFIFGFSFTLYTFSILFLFFPHLAYDVCDLVCFCAFLISSPHELIWILAEWHFSTIPVLGPDLLLPLLSCPFTGIRLAWRASKLKNYKGVCSWSNEPSSSISRSLCSTCHSFLFNTAKRACNSERSWVAKCVSVGAEEFTIYFTVAWRTWRCLRGLKHWGMAEFTNA